MKWLVCCSAAPNKFLLSLHLVQIWLFSIIALFENRGMNECLSYCSWERNCPEYVVSPEILLQSCIACLAVKHTDRAGKGVGVSRRFCLLCRTKNPSACITSPFSIILSTTILRRWDLASLGMILYCKERPSYLHCSRGKSSVAIWKRVSCCVDDAISPPPPMTAAVKRRVLMPRPDLEQRQRLGLPEPNGR